MIGRVEWREGRYQLTGTLKITTVDKSYVLTDPRNPEFVKVTEKLPGGGFGRLLRLQDAGIDLEFVYDDREGKVTVLDYQSGRFYRIQYTKKREEPFSVAPLKEKNDSQEKLAATVVNSPKFVGVSGFISLPEKKATPTESLIAHLYEERLRNRRHLRGPPIEEVSV